ncbi:hypothetical protein M436DRAFT_60809 [Aureobasidium namibiae CBS 147.97]|uniref:Uncharacterized protein n=1 Tax=Aureobasidium namibiae CBS 147.97 TaxID=1043004 RepID=A0A074WZW7_9PEZI
MFVLKFFGLVAAMAVVVNAAPVDDPHPIHQLTPEEEAAQEAAFAAMSLEQRLVYHSEHKVYKPEGTVKCLKECIGDAPGYPIHTATYGEVCKNDKTQSDLIVWLREKVRPCIETKRYAGDSDRLSEDNTPCNSAFSFFESRIDDMCAYIQQELSHTQREDTWEE